MDGEWEITMNVSWAELFLAFLTRRRFDPNTNIFYVFRHKNTRRGTPLSNR